MQPQKRAPVLPGALVRDQSGGDEGPLVSRVLSEPRPSPGSAPINLDAAPTGVTRHQRARAACCRTPRPGSVFYCVNMHLPPPAVLQQCSVDNYPHDPGWSRPQRCSIKFCTRSVTKIPVKHSTERISDCSSGSKRDSLRILRLVLRVLSFIFPQFHIIPQDSGNLSETRRKAQEIDATTGPQRLMKKTSRAGTQREHRKG